MVAAHGGQLNSADATGCFTTVANTLLRSTFSFGVTNIPIYVNGQMVYTPAENRLLQLAANVYDAGKTRGCSWAAWHDADSRARNSRPQTVRGAPP
jgi:hypothetical protein